MSDKTIAIRIHTNEIGTVLAAADADLLGKTLKEGKIHFVVSPAFYHEELITEKELEEKIDEAENMNLVGNKTIHVAHAKGFVELNRVIRIEGVPHAQVYKLI